jgi:hypothetical protein
MKPKTASAYFYIPSIRKEIEFTQEPDHEIEISKYNLSTVEIKKVEQFLEENRQEIERELNIIHIMKADEGNGIYKL